MLVGAQLAVVLDGSVTTVALPVLRSDLGISAGAAQWVITVYAAAFGGTLILGGRISDRYGPRRILLLGLAGFVLFSAVCGAAPGAGVLIGARVGQGMAGALLVPASLALITALFAEGPPRNRALSAVGSAIGIGFVLGQVLGGLLASTLGWRAIFYVNIPIVAVLLTGAIKLPAATPTTDRRRTAAADTDPAGPQPGRHLDYVGGTLITGAVVLLVQLVTALGTTSPTAPAVWISAISFLLITAAAVAHQRRSADPLIPRGLLTRPGQPVANTVTFVFGAVVGAGSLLPTLFLEQVSGYSALITGLLFMPQGIAGILAGAGVYRLLQGRRPQRALVASQAVSAAALLGLAATLHTSGAPIGVIMAMIVLGVGNTTTSILTTIIGSAGLALDEQGVASGVRNTCLQIGISVGVAASVAVATALSQHTSVAASYQLALVAVAALAALSAVATTLTSSRRAWLS